MAHDPGAVQRWAAAHAATITMWAVRTAQSAADTPVPQLPLEPVPAMLAAFTEIHSWDGAAEHINRVAWACHPDGRLLLATGATDGIARIWDAGTGQELHTLTGHTENVDTAEWGRAPDGQLLLATGGFDGTARIWDPDTGQSLHTLTGHSGDPDADAGVIVAWGTGTGGFPVLATGDQGGTVRIWDPGTGQELSAFPAEQPDGDDSPADIYSMDWASGADGQARLATVSFAGGRLRVWDPVIGQVLYASSADRTSFTYSIAYGHRADGQLVLATADESATRVWTENNGGLTEELLPPVDGRTYAARWAVLSDGRALLATATSDAVHLWDGHTLRMLHTEELDFRDTGPGRLDWTLTPDGHLLLATALHGGQVRIWEAVLDPPVWPSEGGARHSPESAPAVPRQPGAARLVLPPEDLRLRFPEAAQIQEQTTSLACVTMPDGRSLLATTHGMTNDVHLWDLESGHHLRALTGHSDHVRDVAWAQAPDGGLLLATTGDDGTARIWNPDTGQELRTLTVHSNYGRAVAWGARPDGTLLLATASADDTVRIWDPDTGQVTRTLTGHRNIVEAVAWGTAPDGTLLLATGGFDGTARIWDPDTGQEIHVLTGHTEPIDAVAWATLPDGAMLLATSCRDGIARIWDPETGHELHALPGPGQQSNPGVFAVAWARAADGRLLLATVGSTGAARIWDPGTGAELASLPGTNSMWRSAAWTRDRERNLLLVLADSDGTSGPVRAWLVETGSGGPAEPQEPGRAGTRRVTQAQPAVAAPGRGWAVAPPRAAD